MPQCRLEPIRNHLVCFFRADNPVTIKWAFVSTTGHIHHHRFVSQEVGGIQNAPYANQRFSASDRSGPADRIAVFRWLWKACFKVKGRKTHSALTNTRLRLQSSNRNVYGFPTSRRIRSVRWFALGHVRTDRSSTIRAWDFYLKGPPLLAFDRALSGNRHIALISLRYCRGTVTVFYLRRMVSPSIASALDETGVLYRHSVTVRSATTCPNLHKNTTPALWTAFCR